MDPAWLSSGAIRDGLFRNVQVLQCRNTNVVLIAEGPESPIENVTLDNVVIASRRLIPGARASEPTPWSRGWWWRSYNYYSR